LLNSDAWAAIKQQTPHLNLEELTFSMQLSSDTMGELVTFCKAAPKLRRLSLKASLSCASSLSELTQVDALQLIDPDLETPAELTALGCLTFLKSLALVGYSIAFPIGSGFNHFSNLKQLILTDMSFESLQIPNADATLQLSQSLAHLTALTYLNFSDFDDGATACLSALPSLTALQDLVLKACISEADKSQLPALSHLTSLTIMALRGNITWNSVQPDALPASLQQIDTDSCRISSLAGLSKLQQLTHLRADCNPLSSCSSLTSLQQLRHLSLRHSCALEALVAAAYLTRLEDLYLGMTDERDVSYRTSRWRLHWQFYSNAQSGRLLVMDGADLYGGAVSADECPELDEFEFYEPATFPSLAGWGRLKRLQLSLDSLPDPATARAFQKSLLAADLKIKELILVSSSYRSGVGLIGVSAFKWVRELDLTRCHYLSSGAFTHLSLLTALTRLLISEGAVRERGSCVSDRCPKRETLAQDTRVWVKPQPPELYQPLGYSDCSDLASNNSGGTSSSEGTEDEDCDDDGGSLDLAGALVELYKGERSLSADSWYETQLQEQYGACTAGDQCLSSIGGDAVWALEGCSGEQSRSGGMERKEGEGEQQHQARREDSTNRVQAPEQATAYGHAAATVVKEQKDNVGIGTFAWDEAYLSKAAQQQQQQGMCQGIGLLEAMEKGIMGGNGRLGGHDSDTEGSSSSGSDWDGVEVDASVELQVPVSSISRRTAKSATKKALELQSLLEASECPLWDLSCLPQLQHLEMTGCNVTEAPCFSALQRLTYLAAGGNQFSSNAIWDIGKQLLQLQHLDLRYGMFPYVHDACSCLGDLTKLTHLHLSAECGPVAFWYRFRYNADARCVQTDTAFPPVCDWGPKHTCVEAAARYGGSWLSFLSSLTLLQDLQLPAAGFAGNEQALVLTLSSTLSSHQHLTQLILQSCTFLNTAGLAGVVAFPQLHQLDLTHRPELVSPGSLFSLQLLTALTRLVLSHNQLGCFSRRCSGKSYCLDRMHNRRLLQLAALEHLQQLQHLELDDCMVMDFSSLSVLHALTHLSAAGNMVSAEGLKVLHQLPCLQHLDLQYSLADGTPAAALCGSVSELVMLTYLRFSHHSQRGNGRLFSSSRRLPWGMRSKRMVASLSRIKWAEWDYYQPWHFGINDREGPVELQICCSRQLAESNLGYGGAQVEERDSGSQRWKVAREERSRPGCVEGGMCEGWESMEAQHLVLEQHATRCYYCSVGISAGSSLSGLGRCTALRELHMACEPLCQTHMMLLKEALASLTMLSSLRLQSLEEGTINHQQVLLLGLAPFAHTLNRLDLGCLTKAVTAATFDQLGSGSLTALTKLVLNCAWFGCSSEAVAKARGALQRSAAAPADASDAATAGPVFAPVAETFFGAAPLDSSGSDASSDGDGGCGIWSSLFPGHGSEGEAARPSNSMGLTDTLAAFWPGSLTEVAKSKQEYKSFAFKLSSSHEHPCYCSSQYASKDQVAPSVDLDFRCRCQQGRFRSGKFKAANLLGLVAAAPNLCHFQINRSHVHNISALTALQGLTYLSAGGNRFTDRQAVAVIRELQQLQHLDLGYSLVCRGYEAEMWDCALQLPALTYLDFSHYDLSKVVEGRPGGLASICINHMQASAEDTDCAVATQRAAATAGKARAVAPIGGISVLAPQAAAPAYRPPGAAADDAMVSSSLFALTSVVAVTLKVLRLEHCSLGDAAIAQLAACCKSLEALHIGWNLVTAEGLAALAPLHPVILQLSLRWMQPELGPSAVDVIASTLPRLQLLDLAGNDCGYAGAEILLRLGLSQLTFLNIAANGVPDGIAKELREFRGRSGCMVELELKLSKAGFMEEASVNATVDHEQGPHGGGGGSDAGRDHDGVEVVGPGCRVPRYDVWSAVPVSRVTRKICWLPHCKDGQLASPDCWSD
jgi:Leucine-rich repeat (LRR) protein